MDILLPPAVEVSNSKPRYLDSTGVSINPFTGQVLTSALGGDRLGMSITFTMSGGGSTDGKSRRAALQAFLMALRGRQNRFYYSDRGYRMRGSFPTGELVSNPAFSNGTTNWSATGGISLTAADGVLRSTLTYAPSNQVVQAAASTVVNGAVYVGRLMVNQGKGTMNWRTALGTTLGATDIALDSSDRTASALTALVGVASGTSMYLSMADQVSGRSTGDFHQIALGSLSRCARVNGGSQTGSQLAIKDLPTSTAGLLAAGDQVEIITARGSELKILTAPLNSDSSGLGSILFEPPLRGSVSDNAAVIMHNPMGRWVLSGNAPEWTDDPGTITTATLDFEEAA